MPLRSFEPRKSTGGRGDGREGCGMNSRDRVAATFEGEPIDRVAKVEYYWNETIRQWSLQGLGAVDREELQYKFGHDLIYFYFDPRFGFQERVVSEDDEYRVIFTVDGETLKIPKEESNLILKSDVAGIPVGYAIHDRRDWERYKGLYSSGEWRLCGQSPISGNWLGGNRNLNEYMQKYELARREGKFTCLVFREPYEAVREFLGTDGMLTLMAEDPELVREMLEHNCRITLEMLDLLRSLGMRMDGYWIWGDIAYTKGMFFSPSMYRELLMPVHRELFSHLGKYSIYHTDGNLGTCLPLLAEAGIRGINPIEIKAGNDLFEISDSYGDDLVLTGGIDVTILSTNVRADIEREVSSKLVSLRGKKYIFHSDHSIPPTVRLESYRYIMDLVDEYGRR